MNCNFFDFNPQLQPPFFQDQAFLLARQEYKYMEQNWQESQDLYESKMKAAVLDVVHNRKYLTEAARDSNLVPLTVKRLVTMYRNASEEERRNFRFAKYETHLLLPKKLEDQLYQFLNIASGVHFEITRKYVRKAAFDLAKMNNIKFPESWGKNQEAGYCWLKGFMNRYPDLQVVKVKPASFEKDPISAFFNNLSNAYTGFPTSVRPHNVYFLDESFLLLYDEHGRVVTSDDAGLVKAYCFLNAEGNSVPPFLVFPNAFCDKLIARAPPGTRGCSGKNCRKYDILFDVLKHFHEFVVSTPESPIILIYDNRETYTPLHIFDFCHANGITLLSIPPNASDYFNPVHHLLALNFKTVCNRLMFMYPGKVPTVYDVAGLFKIAYLHAFVRLNIITGFENTGIWPLNQFKHLAERVRNL